MKTSLISVRGVGLVAAIVGALTFAALWQLRSEPTEVSTPPSPALSNLQKTATPITPAISLVAESVPSAVSTSSASRASEHVLSLYNSSTGGRKLILLLLDRPEQGGHFYAKRLLLACSGVLDILQAEPIAAEGADGHSHAAKQRARIALQKRCGDILPQEIPELLSRIEAPGAAATDPLLRASDTWASEKARGAAPDRLKALGAVLSTQDPLLFDDVGLSLVTRRDSGGPVAYFAGKAYSLREDAAATALYLVPCELGLDCSSTVDPMLAMQCIASEICHLDRHARARIEMVGGNIATLTEAIALSKAIASAIRRQDAAPFESAKN